MEILSATYANTNELTERHIIEDFSTTTREKHWHLSFISMLHKPHPLTKVDPKSWLRENHQVQNHLNMVIKDPISILLTDEGDIYSYYLHPGILIQRILDSGADPKKSPARSMTLFHLAEEEIISFASPPLRNQKLFT
jgi:hypothetical protein